MIHSTLQTWKTIFSKNKDHPNERNPVHIGKSIKAIGIFHGALPLEEERHGIFPLNEKPLDGREDNITNDNHE